MASQRAAVENWFRRVWEEADQDRNEEAIERLFVSEGKAFGLSARPMTGPEDFKPFHRALKGLMTDFRFEIQSAVEMDDRIWVVCTLHGRSRRDASREVALRGFIIATCEGDRVVEAFNLFDFLGLFSQLGQFPEDAFEQGLAGVSFRADA